MCPVTYEADEIIVESRRRRSTYEPDEVEVELVRPQEMVTAPGELAYSPMTTLLEDKARRPYAAPPSAPRQRAEARVNARIMEEEQERRWEELGKTNPELVKRWEGLAGRLNRAETTIGLQEEILKLVKEVPAEDRIGVLYAIRRQTESELSRSDLGQRAGKQVSASIDRMRRAVESFVMPVLNKLPGVKVEDQRAGLTEDQERFLNLIYSEALRPVGERAGSFERALIPAVGMATEQLPGLAAGGLAGRAATALKPGAAGLGLAEGAGAAAGGLVGRTAVEAVRRAPAAGAWAWWTPQIYANRRDQYMAEGLTREQADRAAGWTAPIEAALEMIERNPLMPKTTPGRLARIGRETLARRAARGVGRYGLRVGKESLVEETSQELASEISKTVITETGVTKPKVKEMIRRSIRAGVDAAAPVALMMAPGGMMQAAEGLAAEAAEVPNARDFETMTGIPHATWNQRRRFVKGLRTLNEMIPELAEEITAEEMQRAELVGPPGEAPQVAPEQAAPFQQALPAGAEEMTHAKETRTQAQAPGSQEELESGAEGQVRVRNAPEDRLGAQPSEEAAQEPSAPQVAPRELDNFGIIDPSDVPTTLEGRKAAISEHAIVAGMSRNFGVTLRTGRTRRRMAGVYKKFAHVIRMQGAFAGHLGVATHELAHHIETTARVLQAMPRELRAELAQLDYDEKMARPEEGFAEYMRMLMTEDDSHLAAPNFARWFNEEWLPKNAETMHRLEELKDLITQWRRQGAQARAEANLSRTGRPPRPAGVSALSWAAELTSDAVHRTYAAMKDQFHYIKLFQDDARRRGYAVGPGSTPYDLVMAFSRTGPVQASQAIDNGVFLVSGANYGKRISKGMGEILGQLRPGERDGFTTWMWARHARETWAKGVDPGMARADVDWIYEQNRGNDRWEQVANDLIDFNNALVDMMADAGVIRPTSATKMKEYWQTYMPLHRALDRRRPGLGARKFVDVPDPIRRRIGSGHPIIDPLHSTIDRAVRFYTRAHQEQVIRSMVEMAETIPGMGAWMERVSPKMKPVSLGVDQLKQSLAAVGVDSEAIEGMIAETGIDAADVLTIFKPEMRPGRGESVVRISSAFDPKTKAWTPETPTLYQVHPDLYWAVGGMGPVEYGIFMRTFGAATRMFKLGTVALNPDFMVRNMVRDYLTYLLQREQAAGPEALTAPERMLVAYLRSVGLKAAGRKGDPIVELFQGMGGELSTLLGLDHRVVETRIRDVMRSASGRNLYKIADPRDWVTAARTVVSATEVASRLAEFEASLRNDGWDRARITREGTPPRQVLVRAINAAHEVTVNFKRMGYIGERINHVVPFFNAGLEGLDRFGRFWRDHPRRALIYSLMGSAATVAYWLARKDDDDYKDQPDWLKYGFWTISDENGRTATRIPVPFEWGILVKGGTEALLNAFNDRDPEAIKAWADQAAQGMSPFGYPSGITPIAEAGFNYDLFRKRPIYSPQKAMVRQPPEQYHAYNTETMKAIGRFVNLSPARLEHAVNGVTGGLYRRLAVPIERLAHEGEPMAPSDIPFAGAFSLRHDYTKSVDDFYKRVEQLTQQRGSLQVKGENVPTRLEREYDQLVSIRDLMSEIRNRMPETADKDRRFAYQRYLVGLSRFALNKQELDLYPNPLRAGDLPADLRSVRDQWLVQRLIEVADDSDRDQALQRRFRSKAMLQELAFGPEAIKEILRGEYRRRRADPQARNWTMKYKNHILWGALRELSAGQSKEQ